MTTSALLECPPDVATDLRRRFHTMSPEEIYALDLTYAEWRPRPKTDAEAAWEARCEQLVGWYDTHKYWEFPVEGKDSAADEKKLALWLGQQVKAYLAGKKLTDEQRAQLEKITNLRYRLGDPEERKWQDLENYIAWYDENGRHPAAGANDKTEAYLASRVRAIRTLPEVVEAANKAVTGEDA